MKKREFTGMLEGALEIATDEDAFPVERIRSQRTILHLRVDVTDLPQREVDALATEMIVQGEESDYYVPEQPTPPGRKVFHETQGHRSVYVAADLEVEEGPFVKIDGNEFRIAVEQASVR